MARGLDIGQFQQLPIAQMIEGGVQLAAGRRQLFLPTHLVPTNAEVGSLVEVFVYADHEGEPQATTHVPVAVVGEFAYCPCVAVTRAGAFVSWGIPKDLYVPPDEQVERMVEGRSYVVAVCLDKKGQRPIGSTDLRRHFDYHVEHLEPDDEVELLVVGPSDVGVQVVVERRHRGLIHPNELHRALRPGDELRGFIRNVRYDNRLDIALSRRGLDAITDAQTVILEALRDAGGFLPLHDRSAPSEIERTLGLSKKAFKRGAGGLYKARKISIDDDGIRLVTVASRRP